MWNPSVVWRFLVAGFLVACSNGTSAAADRLSQQFRGEIRDIAVIEPAATPQPDDFDLSAMAKSALNYLRGNPDPKRNYECKWSLGPLGIPLHVPVIASNQWGFDPISLGDTDSRMQTQYVNMRRMAGEPEVCPVELGVKQRVYGYQHDDGLSWINPVAYVGVPVDGEWAGSWTTAKLLMSLAEEFQRTGDARTKDRARKTFLALKGIALWDGPRAYYPGIAPLKDGQWLREGWCAEHARNYPFIVEPCVRYWECTGDPESLEFAKAVTEGFLAGSQKDQAEMRIDPQTGAFQKHVHLHTHAVWGVAHLGAVVKEPRYIDFARKTYEFVLANGTDFGWYPEFIPQPEYRTEICAVGDMASLAAWLARSGLPHYWDHLERTVRNELRRSQFFLTPQFVGLFREIHKDKSESAVSEALEPLRRIEGGFVAQATFDDWVGYPNNPRLGTAGLSANGIQMMGCCPPEGMRALWEAYRAVVEERDGSVLVNMAISRDHPAAKVTAYRPQDGRFDVAARKPGTFLLRVPAWADRPQVQLLRGGKPGQLTWGGDADAYLVCAEVAAGEVLTVSWPVPRFTQVFIPLSVPARNQPVTVRWVGNEVRSVEPRGQYLPMFTGP
ncbi:MAG: hypothetical protein HUU20_24045 [Pirellulales bacterium]|nr:hypothetical protein [Pirellulales bacterium]